VYDHREEELPAMELVPFVDQETGKQRIINTSSRSVRTNMPHTLRKRGLL
jgi:hypothetical protein